MIMVLRRMGRRIVRRVRMENRTKEGRKKIRVIMGILRVTIIRVSITMKR